MSSPGSIVTKSQSISTRSQRRDKRTAEDAKCDVEIFGMIMKAGTPAQANGLANGNGISNGV